MSLTPLQTTSDSMRRTRKTRTMARLRATELPAVVIAVAAVLLQVSALRQIALGPARETLCGAPIGYMGSQARIASKHSLSLGQTPVTLIPGQAAKIRTTLWSGPEAGLEQDLVSSKARGRVFGT